jgi:hypothetical protein
LFIKKIVFCTWFNFNNIKAIQLLNLKYENYVFPGRAQFTGMEKDLYENSP